MCVRQERWQLWVLWGALHGWVLWCALTSLGGGILIAGPSPPPRPPHTHNSSASSPPSLPRPAAHPTRNPQPPTRIPHPPTTPAPQDFHAGTMCAFYSRWLEGKKTMRDSGFVLRDLEAYVRKKPGAVCQAAHSGKPLQEP